MNPLPPRPRPARSVRDGVRATVVGIVLVGATALTAGQPAKAAPGTATPIDFSLKVTPTAGSMNDEFVATVQISIRGVSGPERFWAPDFGDFTVIDQRTQQSTQWFYDPVHGQ